VKLPQSIQPVDATHVRYRGRRLVYFGGCDYYQLTRHPHLLKAHAQAVARDGLGTGASRMTTGNHPVHYALEAVLKKFFDCESATVIGDGYLTNIALGQAEERPANPSIDGRCLWRDRPDYPHREPGQGAPARFRGLGG